MSSVDGEEAPMKVSREQVALNREAILRAAGRLFRERGVEAVTVAEVMGAAGLTHGGFYGYFKSKDELVAAAIAQALDGSPPPDDLDTYVAAYLAPSHRDDRAGGCAVAALAAETVRSPPAARSEMTKGLRRQIDTLASLAPGADAAERRQAAIGSWAALVGALVLARVSDDAALSDEVLAGTRAWLTKQNTAPVRES
jgi:TetR/AcrR family transcriptional repressor of nem operon